MEPTRWRIWQETEVGVGEWLPLKRLALTTEIVDAVADTLTDIPSWREDDELARSLRLIAHSVLAPLVEDDSAS